MEQGVGVGMLLFGNAQIRNVHVLRNGAEVAIPRLRAVTERDLAAIRSAASPIDLSAASPSLDALLRRRVIALGEASHGAAALFALKISLIEAIARTRGLAVVALEAPAAAAETINAYVLGESDDRAAVIEALVYPAWRTEEMLALIDWLRAHNASASTPIQFAGFDIQHPDWALARLQARGVDVGEVSASLQAVDAQRALAALDAVARTWSPDDARARYARLVRSAVLVDRRDLGGKSRDEYMAEEVALLATAHAGRIVLWGDNTHVTRRPGAMGGYLGTMLGDQYAAIGFSFAEGAYSAYGPNSPYDAQSAYDGTHEHVLADAGVDGALIALADLPQASPLLEPRGWRYIGSRPQEFGQFLPHDLRGHFDAVGFSARSAATRSVAAGQPD